MTSEDTVQTTESNNPANQPGFKSSPAKDDLAALKTLNIRLSKRIKELELLLELNSLSSQRLSRDETLLAIQNLFVKTFRLDHYLLLLKNESANQLQLCSHQGVDLKDRLSISLDSGKSVLDQILASGESVFIPDLSTEKQLDLHLVKWISGSVLLLPLVSEHNSVMGVIVLHRSRKNTFLQGDIEFLQFMATHAAGVIDKSILFQDTQELAYTDSLTGIFNRRYFDQRFSREILRARRYSRSLALLMIDIDYFKNFNDTYGHLMGDAVLKNVAEILESKLRRADILCRYGGEEFVVILPESNLTNAEIVAEKLRAAIMVNAHLAHHQIPNQHVTISVGVSAFPDSGTEEKIVLDQADKALYRAKRRGRNLVCVAR